MNEQELAAMNVEAFALLAGTSAEEVATPTTASEKDTQKPVETVKEEPKTAETAPTIDEIKQEARIQADREAKRKYLSQVNQAKQAAKEADERANTLLEGYEPEQLEAIKSIVQREAAAKDISRLEELERSTFIKEHNPAKDELAGIEEVKNDFPNMSWEYARKVYLADTNPEKLVQPKTPDL